MEKIAVTVSHTIMVDPMKNRVYCKLLGNGGRDDSDFVDFYLHCEAAAELVAEGFTMLFDATQVRTLPQEWIVATTQVQRYLLTRGIAGIAEITPENLLVKMQLAKIAKRSGVEPRQMFTNPLEAEVWLDRVAAQRATTSRKES